MCRVHIDIGPLSSLSNPVATIQAQVSRRVSEHQSPGEQHREQRDTTRTRTLIIMATRGESHGGAAINLLMHLFL